MVVTSATTGCVQTDRLFLGTGIRHYVGRLVASLGAPGVRSDGRGASRRVQAR
jgi:hypothetical protein